MSRWNSGLSRCRSAFLQHQRELRHHVLQIVDDERRHPVEGVELARLEQRFGRLHLPEISSPPGAPAVLSRSRTSQLTSTVARGVEQHDEADQLAPRRTAARPARHRASTRARPAAELASSAPGARRYSRSIDDPAGAREKLRRARVPRLSGASTGGMFQRAAWRKSRLARSRSQSAPPGSPPGRPAPGSHRSPTAQRAAVARKASA